MVFESSSAYISFYTGAWPFLFSSGEPESTSPNVTVGNGEGLLWCPDTSLSIGTHAERRKRQCYSIVCPWFAAPYAPAPAADNLPAIGTHWERRVRPSYVFLQTSSNLEAEPNFSAGPPTRWHLWTKHLLQHFLVFLECMSQAVTNFYPFLSLYFTSF